MKKTEENNPVCDMQCSSLGGAHSSCIFCCRHNKSAQDKQLGELSRLFDELDVLRMFILHHSFSPDVNLIWYEEQILKVKYKICLIITSLYGLPEDYSEFTEVYGSTCGGDEDEQTGEM